MGDIGIIRRRIELEPIPEDVPVAEPSPELVPEPEHAPAGV